MGPGAGVQLVTAGLADYVRQHKAQLSVAGLMVGTVAVTAPHSDWSMLMAQVAQWPPDVPVEAWAACLLVLNLLRVAACATLCFGTARYLDRRRAQTDDLIDLLASRQDTMHRYATGLLDRMQELGVEDGDGSVAAFRTWFLSQLETSDLLLRELRGDGPRSSAAGQLQSVMNRLGLIAGVLLRMSSGEVLNKHSSKKSGDKQQGIGSAVGSQRRLERQRNSRRGRDSLTRERQQLERLVRMRHREDHATAFQQYVADMEAHLERSLSLQLSAPAPPHAPLQPDAQPKVEEDVQTSAPQAQPHAEAEAAVDSPHLPSPSAGGQDGLEPGCACREPLTTCEEGDCDEASDASVKQGPRIDWHSLTADWALLGQEETPPSADGSRNGSPGSADGNYTSSMDE